MPNLIGLKVDCHKWPRRTMQLVEFSIIQDTSSSLNFYLANFINNTAKFSKSHHVTRSDPISRGVFLSSIVRTLEEDQPLRLLMNLLFYHFNRS